jgi:hypothetical protein
MKINPGRHGIEIVPEGVAEERYLEEVLNIHKAGDTAEVVFETAHGSISFWGRLFLQPKAKK